MWVVRDPWNGTQRETRTWTLRQPRRDMLFRNPLHFCYVREEIWQVSAFVSSPTENFYQWGLPCVQSGGVSNISGSISIHKTWHLKALGQGMWSCTSLGLISFDRRSRCLPSHRCALDPSDQGSCVFLSQFQFPNLWHAMYSKTQGRGSLLPRSKGGTAKHLLRGRPFSGRNKRCWEQRKQDNALFLWIFTKPALHWSHLCLCAHFPIPMRPWSRDHFVFIISPPEGPYLGALHAADAQWTRVDLDDYETPTV